ncbi:MAG: hypothetical protein Q9172_003165 [Xanthocarpia lactea]
MEEGRQMAEEFKCGFTEASARLDINVTNAFQQMIAEVEKSQNPAEPTEGLTVAVHWIELLAHANLI